MTLIGMEQSCGSIDRENWRRQQCWEEQNKTATTMTKIHTEKIEKKIIQESMQTCKAT